MIELSLHVRQLQLKAGMESGLIMMKTTEIEICTLLYHHLRRQHCQDRYMQVLNILTLMQ